MHLSHLLLLLALLALAHNQACSQNYQYPDQVTSTCVPCPPSCLSCFDSVFCTACIPEYYLDNNLCLSCPFGCAVCASGGACMTCVDGLYVNGDGDCVPCGVGVATCTIAIVETCRSGYFMLGDICAGCFDNCATCQDFVTCSLCDRGYYVGPNSTSCRQCSPNCAVCQDNTTCTSCTQGYVLNGGSCVAPSCSTISPFCTKCANGMCQQCSYGKYVNSNGTCSQGASLLCYSATGPYRTNCQTNLYGCPLYSQVQTDLITNAQLPICLPLHATQNSEFLFFQYGPSCTISSAAACGAASSNIYTFATLKSYYSLNYHISMKIYSTAVQDFTVSYIDANTNNSLAFKLHKINITTQLADNMANPQCFNCQYGYIIIDGQLSISGGSNNTLLELRSMSSFFEVSELMIETGLCKVARCSACTTAIDCVECHSPYFLQLISCVQECDPGFYKYGRTCVLSCPTDAYPIQSSYECSKCQSPCLTCSSLTQCLSCVDGYFLDGQSCVTTCSSPTLFTNLTSKACQTCPNPCTQCLVTTNSTNSSNITWSVSCSGCGVGYLLQNGNCTYLCPTGTFANFANNKTQCTSCQTGCSECAISSSICMACTSSYLLGGSTCLMNFVCPVGYFVNLGKNSCEKCHYPCLTCDVVGQNCTSCLKGALYNYTCPLECPSGMFIQYSQSSQICSSCASPCIECLSISVCLTCVNGTYLYNGQCLAQCPVLTYYPQLSNNTCLPCIPPCLQCQSPTHCLSCTTGYMDLSTHSCTLQCNDTSYPDTNFVCRPCTLPCIRCFSASTCSMCALPSVLDSGACITVALCDALNKYVHYRINYTDPALSNESATCQQCTYPCASCANSPIVCKSCVAGYKFVRDLAICVQECPQSYYSSINGTTNMTQCLKCDSNCLNCYGLATNCTQCGTSMYLFTNNTCLLACPAQYYGNNEQQVCKTCQLPCLDCYNVYLCKSCVTGIYYNKGCVSSCPAGSIHNLTSNTCDQCTNNCLACSILPSDCTECPTNGFYFHNNQCLSSCPVLFYADDLSHNCEPCIQPCKECTASTQCKNCMVGYYLLQASSRCTTVCPEGYFPDNATLVCQPCNGTVCRACTGTANNCTKCAQGYYFNSNVSACAQSCPTGTYADDFYLQCRQCQFPCNMCNISSCFSCLGSYHLYNSNCYANCPIGYYSSPNNTCSQCEPICQLCSSASVCLKCVAGYYVNASSMCVPHCQLGYYGGYDQLTSYAVCQLCPGQCVACAEAYNCTQCQPNNYSFNGLCLDQCPSLYYAASNSSCLACPAFCNKCTNSTSCLQCVNSYIYHSLCYSSCPATTYTQNQELCVDCSLPCKECTSQFSCLSCLAGYYYFQNYCVEKCPADVWKYPETQSCQAECPYNKYTNEMLCYRNGCGGMLVQLNSYCLDQCPTGYYVDQQQNCIECTASSTASTICKKPMTGQLQILRSYNLRACLYFSELIQQEDVDVSRIVVSWYNKGNGDVIAYQPVGVTVADGMIVLEFGFMHMELYRLEVKIPYIVSRQTPQSVSHNLFKADINVYNNYQYQQSSIPTTSTSTSTTGSRLLAGSEFNTLYSPSTALSAIAIVIVSATFLCLVVNIVVKGTHYRQLLDFLQFVAATVYLEIQYPPILQQYLSKMRISLFTVLPQLANFQPYAFSPSKFIEYHKDSSLLRTQGILFLFFATALLSFALLIVINRLKPHLLRPAIRRIKYRNITDLFSICSLPFLLFSFRFANSSVPDVVVSVLALGLVVGFVVYMSYLLMTVRNLQEIVGLAGQLEATESPLGQMYTPFSFIRKIIFGLVLCIQPYKPISTLTLLLIFTILIMVCLFFYQPFENQLTDYVCISLEIVLVIYVVIVMLFGLNAVTGPAAHYLGIVAAAVTGLGAAGGLGWLVYLTVGAVNKYRKEEPVNQDNALEENINSQANGQTNQNKSEMDPNSAMKINSKDQKQSQQAQQNHQNEQEQADEPSASQLITGIKVKPPSKGVRKSSKFSQQMEVQISDSQQGPEQFKHWGNSDSQKQSQTDHANKAPKYLLKKQKNQEQRK